MMRVDLLISILSYLILWNPADAAYTSRQTHERMDAKMRNMQRQLVLNTVAKAKELKEIKEGYGDTPAFQMGHMTSNVRKKFDDMLSILHFTKHNMTSQNTDWHRGHIWTNRYLEDCVYMQYIRDDIYNDVEQLERFERMEEGKKNNEFGLSIHGRMERMRRFHNMDMNVLRKYIRELQAMDLGVPTAVPKPALRRLKNIHWRPGYLQ